MQPGTRITHKTHGAGTVIARDFATDPVTKKQIDTTRLGIHFDEHTLLADPAYFWPEEITALED